MSIYFFLFFLLSLSTAQEDCISTTSKCSDDGPPIRFPFRLKNQHPPHCGYPGFDLSCSPNNTTTVLDLPNSVKVLVTDIDYKSQLIHIKDLNGCFPQQLQNLKLSTTTTPFKFADFVCDIGLFSCPPSTKMEGEFRVTCLHGGDGRDVYFQYNISIDYTPELISCRKMYNVWSVPDKVFDQTADLQLQWLQPECGKCETDGKFCRLMSNSTSSEILCSPKKGEGVVQGLRERAIRARITAAYAIPITSRYAPELIGYKPTYTSYLKKKPRRQGVPRAGRGGGGRVRAAGRGERGRGRGRGRVADTEGSNSGPLGTLREELDRETPERTGLSDEMSGRGRVVENLRRQRRPAGRGVGVVIGTPGAGSSRPASVSSQEPPEKRARLNEGEDNRGKGPKTVVLDEEGIREADTRGETDAEAAIAARLLAWAPEVRHYTGRMIHHADCATLNLGTAYGLLKSAILPKDEDRVKGCTVDLTGEIAQSLLAVGAWALVINDRSRAQEQEIEALKLALAQKDDDLKLARESCNLYQADFEKADQERALAEGRAKKAEEDSSTLRAAQAREVEAARNRGYDEGWDAAGVEYKKQVREIEAELHRDRFLDGLRYGHETLANKVGIPEDSELRVLPEAPPEELVLPEDDVTMGDAEVDQDALAPKSRAAPDTLAPEGQIDA